MIKAAFLGFQTGSVVDLAVSQDIGGAGSIRVSSWVDLRRPTPVPGAQNVTIAMTRTHDQVAPDPVIFEAIPSGFSLPSPPGGATEWRPAEHRLLYKWTFTAQGRDWTYYTGAFPEWDDVDHRYGPKVTQMIYDARDDFQATVEVWGENGEYATATVMLDGPDATVDPDVYFAGSETVVVDPSGVGDPSHPGAVVETTIDDAFTPSNAGKRVLLRRGEIYTATWNLYNTSASDEFYLSAWGTGPIPIVNWTGSDRMFLLHQNCAGVPRFVDIDMRGPGDLAGDLTTALPTEPGHLLWVQSQTPVVMVGCSFSQHAKIADFNTTSDTHMIFWDCKITKWWDYGMLLGAPDGSLSIVGTDMSQDPDVGSGGPKFKSPQVYENHGPTRFSKFESVYMDCVNFASLSGHFASGGYTDIQPSVRLTELATGAYVHASRIFSEGPITAVNTNGGTDNYPLNMVLDKYVVLITSAEGNGGRAVAIERGGVTVRNGLVISDNVKNWQFQSETNQYGPMVSIRNQAVLSGSSQFEPIEVYGLTLVDRLSTVNNTGVIARVDDEGDFDNVTVSGVVTHAPFKDMPDVPFAPMTEGSALAVQAVWKGPAYRPGAFRYDLISSIDASQTAGIIIDEDKILDRFAVEGAPLTFILGGDEAGEQITATGATLSGSDYELTGVTRGVNGTTAASHVADSEMVWSGPIARLTSYEATADFAASWMPTVGSSAIAGSTGDTVKPLDDILGALRTSVADVDSGAFQVSS